MKAVTSLPLLNLLLMPALGTHAAVVLTTLHSFTGTNDGAQPYAGLVQGSDGYFYGTTAGGGTHRAGSVFKICATGTLTTLYSFTGGLDGGLVKAGLVQGADGYFYGRACAGGTNNDGTVFKINTNGALTTLYSFTGANDGGEPLAALVQGSDGFFYGTTPEGAATHPNYGTVFKISANGALTNLYSFSGKDGYTPQAAPLVQGSDGYLYGTTSFGGTNGTGTVFKISTNGVLASLYSFIGSNDGGYPYAGLVQGRDGYFYGTTPSGGTNGTGTVFKISTSGALTSLCSFTWTNSDNGVNYQAGLVQGRDGYLYGTTYRGGANGVGTVFKVSTNGTLTTLYSFTGANDGGYPQDGLVQGSNSCFYGTTTDDGAYGGGTVFRLALVPEFQAVTLTNSSLILTWSTEPGANYQLQYGSDLNTNDWTNLGSVLTAGGAELSATDSVINCPIRFYRVALLP